MQSRVGTLKLHLRVPPELAASATHFQQQIERDLMLRVLEELERLLHAELGPNAVIRIRRLSLRWRLDATELVTNELIVRLANDLSRGLLAELAQQPSSTRLRPRGDTIAVFSDGAHASAAALADAADTVPAHWAHDGLSAREVWERAAADPHLLARVVTWLVRMERLAPAVALATEEVLAALAERVPEAAPIVALIRARRAAASGAPLPSPPTRVDAPASLRPEPIDRAPPPDDARPAGVDAAATPLPVVPQAVLDAPPVRVDRERVDPIAEPVMSPPEAPARDAETIAPLHETATAYAGLFYLVGRALEIDLAEQLWAAGLPEGNVLAHIAAAVVGDVADPAWRWFGGIYDSPPALAPIASWAVAEVNERMQHALGRRLVRFGLTLTPAALAARLDHLEGALRPAVPIEPTAARLVTRSAAALAMITCARLDVPPSVAAVREVCARPGRLVLTPAALHIVIPIASSTIEHRRAGLDQDPGHVPWLRRKLHIELAGAPEL